MIKKRFISILVLLCLTVSGAWADDLYLVVDDTSATLMYGDKEDNPYYSENLGFVVNEENDEYDDKDVIETVTVDASCMNFEGGCLNHLFDGFESLTEINNLENLNTEQVGDMEGMFNVCGSLETLDLSSFNTGQVKYMNNMFQGCSSLSTIYVGDGWSTASVTNGNYMFEGCTSLPGYDSGKDTHEMAKLTTDGGYLQVKPATVAVTGVTLSPTTATLTLGETTTLTPIVAPDDATDKTVTWSSSNTSVATVSNEGVVTAVGAGTAIITVTATNGTDVTTDDQTATCTVTVAEPQPEIVNPVQIDGLYYNLDADNMTAEVTYKSYANWNYNEGWDITTANIPASVEYNSVTYSVTSIGGYAFQSCSDLTSVTIPNSVTSIGSSAFSSCI